MKNGEEATKQNLNIEKQKGITELMQTKRLKNNLYTAKARLYFYVGIH